MAEQPKAPPGRPMVDTSLSPLALAVEQRAPSDSVRLLSSRSDEDVVQVLAAINPAVAIGVLLKFPAARRAAILNAAPPDRRDQWTRNQRYPEGSVGRLMEPPAALFAPETTVQDAVTQLREEVKRTLITYGHVVDKDGVLLGVVVMRDVLLAEPTQRLDEIMIRDPFSLAADRMVLDVVPEVLRRHYPVYPVCDERGRLIGLVRGYALFEEQAVEISAQPGLMVGVEQEERVASPWWTSLRFRHPWLQINLLTTFLAAAVVGVFEHTISQIVVLAAFLPVLSGQSTNTGCQALAVTLRGMTLGDLDTHHARPLIMKESWLGLLNGAIVGITAGAGMLAYAMLHHAPQPWALALVVLLAMIGSCALSSVCGALAPLALKRFGADPATASSILLTTITDVVSMGLFLWLATLLVL